MNIDKEMARIMDELAIAEKEYEQEQKEKRKLITQRRQEAEHQRYLKEKMEGLA